MAWPHHQSSHQALPQKQETMKGHGQKGKSGLQSTKLTEPIIKIEPGTINRTHLQASTKTHKIFIDVFNIKEEAVGTIYTNQPGRFTKKSSKGNQYIMVLTHIDSNAILTEAMKNRTAGKIIRAYQVLINCLLQAGITPKQHILDNKCSKEFKATICKNNMTFQLVPPLDHWRKFAEKAIQTFKGHFISILCRTDKDFPLHLWCCLLPQAEHTLNMLQSA